MAKIPVKKLNDGTTNYFPVSVLDSVFLNKEIEVKNTIGGLSKGVTLPVNTSLYVLLNRILNDEGVDVQSQLDDKVDKVDGKGLSTNDFTDSYKDSLDNLSVDLSNKVDKVTGKGLSTEDFTSDLKTKLTNIDLTNYVQKDGDKVLSSNDFTNDLKTKLDNIDLTNYVQKDGTKVLSTNDFTNDYKDKIDGLGSISSKNFWVGTKAEYDAIETKDGSTLYFIKES